jgi:F0F1-type ATP synthase assembly protein I
MEPELREDGGPPDLRGAGDRASGPTGDGPPSEKEGFGWALWTSAGFEFAAAVLLFFLLGSWADATWATHPWMRVAGAGLGVVVGMYALIRKALESDRREEKRRSGGPRN